MFFTARVGRNEETYIVTLILPYLTNTRRQHLPSFRPGEAHAAIDVVEEFWAAGERTQKFVK
jgi:hypothetical protein